MTPTVLVIGASGSGKTTLVEAVLPVLARRGVRVATVKHASHGFDIDHPGKDSARHWDAGAVATLIVGPDELVVRARTQPESLGALVEQFAGGADLVLAEGFSWEPGPRILVRRRGVMPKEPASMEDVVLVATDEPTGDPREVAPDDVEAIADAIERATHAAATTARANGRRA